MSAVRSLWTWVGILLCGMAAFAVQLLLLPSLLWDRRRWWLGRAFRRAAVVASHLAPTWDFGVAGEVPRRLARPMVVVSNHESNADPFLISHLPWEMKWLGKQTLFRVPFIGWAMWLAGDIALVRGVPDSAKHAMAQCAEWLRRGVSVMIFPEGTRSPTDDLLPFKDGAFRLAIESGVDILPLAVSGTRDALPKHAWRVGPAVARVKVGQPIATQGLTVEDVPWLKERTRAAILALRSASP